MADFNLLGAGAGAAGGLEVLLKRLLDESDQKQKYGILQQEVNQRGRIADQTNQRLIEQNQLNSQIRKDALAQQVASQADAARVRGEQQVDRRISLRGPGDEVTPQEMNAEVASGVPTSLYNKIPGAQVTQTQGIAALPQSAPSGVSTLPMKAPVMPSLPSTTTTEADSPLNAPSKINFRGTGSQRQAVTKEEDVRAKNDDSNQRAIDRIQAAAQAAETAGNLTQAKILYTQAETMLANARTANVGQTADKLVKVEHKDDKTGKTVIEWLPQSSLRGQTFEKGVGSALETRLASAGAVTQTGNDIIAAVSDPKVQAALGPALGRAGKLRDWIGNPPPEFSELAGNIESYALANMGVHGMRSTQGAQLISQLLDQHHTPESLAAAVRGLQNFSRHFMENEGRPVPQANDSTSPQGDTSKPKRMYDPATGTLK